MALSGLSGGAGSGGLAGEAGLSGASDFFGLNLIGQPPQWDKQGSTILTKTYAFEIFPIRPSSGSPSGVSGTSHVYYFGMNPTQVSFTDFGSGITTYTAGSVVVEGGTTLLRQYTVAGRSGVSVRRGYSSGENPALPNANHPNRLSADGHRLFRELHRFFKHYSSIKADPVNSHRFAMAFHDFVNDDHFIISPTQFSVDRQGNSDYKYNIQFDAIAQRVGFELGLLASIGGAIQTVTDVVSTTINNVAGLSDDLTGSVAEFGGMIGNAMSQVANSIKRLDGSLSTLIETRGGVDLFLENVDRGVDELTGSVKNFDITETDKTSRKDNAETGAVATTEVRQMLNAQDVEQDGLRAIDDPSASEISVILDLVARNAGRTPPLSVSNDFNPIKDSKLINAKRSAILLENALYALVVEEESRAETVSRNAGTNSDDTSFRMMAQATRDFTDFSNMFTKQVPVYRGDTIKSIALRHTGTFDSVEYIINLNNLKFPYISETGEPFTVMYGKEIKVPSLDNPNSLVASRKTDSIDRALFGEDFRLTKIGDMVLSNSLDDFSLISGIENLKQALEIIKFRTKQRNNPLFPEIGMPDLIGEPSTEDNILSAYLGAKMVAETDARISSVSASAYYDNGDSVEVMLNCKAISSNESFEIGVIR